MHGIVVWNCSANLSYLVQLMALLLLRHALSVTDGDNTDDDPSTFFSLFLLRAAGFLLPCYIMAWAISILQRRRQRQVSFNYSSDKLFSCAISFHLLSFQSDATFDSFVHMSRRCLWQNCNN